MARLITLTVVGCFCVLVCYAYGRADALRPHPIVVHTGEPDMVQASHGATKPVALWKKPSQKAREVARVLGMVYHVTQADINADIFGGDR